MADEPELCPRAYFLLNLNHWNVLYFDLKVLRVDSWMDLLDNVVEELANVIVGFGRDIREVESHLYFQ